MARIFLIGPRASGKTTLARDLASALGYRQLDTDTLVIARIGTSISSYVAANGWDAFREQEHLALVDAVTATDKDSAIIATGGGIVLLEANRNLMRKNGTCLYIDVPVSVMVSRLSRDPDLAQRPSLTGRDTAAEVTDVVRLRRPLYLETAHHVIDGLSFTPGSCTTVLRFLKNSNILP